MSNQIVEPQTELVPLTKKESVEFIKTSFELFMGYPDKGKKMFEYWASKKISVLKNVN